MRSAPALPRPIHTHTGIWSEKAIIHCGNSNVEKSTRVPRIPQKPGPDENRDESRYTTFYRKLWHRQDFFRRIGLKADDPRNDLRICKCHPMEQKPVVFPIKVTFPDGAGGWISKSKRCEFKGLPIALGIKSNRPEAPAATLSKGTGLTRQMNRLLEEAATNQNDNLLPLQQVMEVNDGGRSALPDIHPRLRRSSGLDEHVPTPKNKRRATTLWSKTSIRNLWLCWKPFQMRR